MDQYCVVLCGRQAGVAESSIDWSPVASALKLSQAEFAQRVVAALPLIVRRGLDHAAAARIAQRLQAMQLDARVVPDDSQLAYIRRGEGICGPVPYSALHDFIAPGDSWRLRNNPDWQPWPNPLEEEDAPAVLPDLELVTHPEPSHPIDEPVHATMADTVAAPVTESLDESDAAWSPPSPDEHDAPISVPAEEFPPGSAFADEFTAAVSDASSPIPPPLPEQSSMQDLPPPAFAAEAVAATVSDDAHALENDLVNPSDEDAAAIEAGEGAVADPYDAAEAPPRRSRAGLLIGLLIVAGLAYWAYTHWIADTNGGAPATPKTMLQPSKPAPTAMPAVSTSAAAPTTGPATAASSPALATSTVSVPAPAASSPATASSATGPASSASAQTPASTTSTAVAPLATGASIPAPATPITAEPAADSAEPKH